MRKHIIPNLENVVLTNLCFVVLEDVVAEDLENEVPSPDNAEQTVLSATVLFVF